MGIDQRAEAFALITKLVEKTKEFKEHATYKIKRLEDALNFANKSGVLLDMERKKTKHFRDMGNDGSFECMEIGKHVAEIASKGWILNISSLGGEMVRLDAKNDGRFLAEPMCGTLLCCLRRFVNMLRRDNEELTLEEEAEESQRLKEEHGRIPLFERGDEQQCTCGSRKPLKRGGKLTFDVDWLTGEHKVDLNMPTDWDDDAQCPDCKKWYRMKP